MAPNNETANDSPIRVKTNPIRKTTQSKIGSGSQHRYSEKEKKLVFRAVLFLKHHKAKQSPKKPEPLGWYEWATLKFLIRSHRSIRALRVSFRRWVKKENSSDGVLWNMAQQRAQETNYFEEEFQSRFYELDQSRMARKTGVSASSDHSSKQVRSEKQSGADSQAQPLVPNVAGPLQTGMKKAFAELSSQMDTLPNVLAYSSMTTGGNRAIIREREQQPLDTSTEAGQSGTIANGATAQKRVEDDLATMNESSVAQVETGGEQRGINNYNTFHITNNIYLGGPPTS